MTYQDPSTLSPGTKVDQYVISGVLGRGGFGITYLVHDESLQKDFALKEFFPEDLVIREGTSIRFTAKPHSESDYRWGLKKFYDEARLLAQFSHSNIVSVRRVFEENNSAYMLLDFVRGSTLEKWLQGLDSPPTQEELDLIATPLLSALELVHANRTWHLDISPDNVMIRATDGAPILLDFGASRFEIKQHSQLVSALVFKSGYSAPEQYTSNADRYGPWTDIYAFAATLHRAMSGSRPIEATSRQLSDELRPAAVIGKGRYRDKFLKAIDWALKLPPQDRPRSISEWRKELLQGGGAPAPMAKTRVLTGRNQSSGEPPAVFERATDRQARLAVRPRRPFRVHRRRGRPMPLAGRRRGRRPVRAGPAAQPRDVRQGGRPLLCRRRVVGPVRRQHRLLGCGGGKERRRVRPRQRAEQGGGRERGHEPLRAKGRAGRMPRDQRTVQEGMLGARGSAEQPRGLARCQRSHPRGRQDQRQGHLRDQLRLLPRRHDLLRRRQQPGRRHGLGLRPPRGP